MLIKNRRKKVPEAGDWKLHDARTRFDEIVRRAWSEGPQRVTVHGKVTVVVLSAEDYAKVGSPGGSEAEARTAADLIPIMQKGRRLGLKLKPSRIYLSARPPIDFSGNGQ